MMLQYGLLSIIYYDDEVLCADEKCGRLILKGASCFVDTLDNAKLYCDDCGKCLRYARKMAKKREEINVHGNCY